MSDETEDTGPTNLLQEIGAWAERLNEKELIEAHRLVCLAAVKYIDGMNHGRASTHPNAIDRRWTTYGKLTIRKIEEAQQYTALATIAAATYPQPCSVPYYEAIYYIFGDSVGEKCVEQLKEMGVVADWRFPA